MRALEQIAGMVWARSELAEFGIARGLFAA